MSSLNIILSRSYKSYSLPSSRPILLEIYGYDLYRMPGQSVMSFSSCITSITTITFSQISSINPITNMILIITIITITITITITKIKSRNLREDQSWNLRKDYMIKLFFFLTSIVFTLVSFRNMIFVSRQLRGVISLSISISNPLSRILLKNSNLNHKSFNNSNKNNNNNSKSKINNNKNKWSCLK